MTTPLEYAPQQKWHQRRRFRRAAFNITFLAALSLCLWQFGPPIASHLRMLYLQRQCMTRPTSPAVVTTAPSSMPITPIPAELDAYNQFLPPIARTYDDKFFTPTSTAPADLVFLRTLNAGVGERLIVAYFHYPLVRNQGCLVSKYRTLVVQVIQPATLFSKPRVLSESLFDFNSISERRILNFAARPLADKPAFTIETAATVVDYKSPTFTSTATFNLTFRLSADDTVNVDTNEIKIRRYK